jgi:hypothetical protein
MPGRIAVHPEENRSRLFRMSEDPPPPYLTRTLVCRVCGKSYSPPPDEAEALAELERTFGLDPAAASGTCEECSGRRVQ